MNWVEEEFAAIAQVEPDPYIVWISGEWPERCDHRWMTRPDYKPLWMCGFFTLPIITVCRKCGAQA